MSNSELIRRDLRHLKNQWKSLDPTVRLLDVISIGLIFIFSVAFFAFLVFEEALIVTNVVLMIYPLIMSGLVFTLRSQLAEPEPDVSSAKKEFLILTLIMTLFIPASFLYSYLLDQA